MAATRKTTLQGTLYAEPRNTKNFELIVLSREFAIVLGSALILRQVSLDCGKRYILYNARLQWANCRCMDFKRMVPLLYLKNLLIAVNEIDVNNFTSSDVPGNGLGLLICALATVWPYVQKKKACTMLPSSPSHAISKMSRWFNFTFKK